MNSTTAAAAFFAGIRLFRPAANRKLTLNRVHPPILRRSESRRVLRRAGWLRKMNLLTLRPFAYAGPPDLLTLGPAFLNSLSLVKKS
jgi:hypothetical protein